MQTFLSFALMASLILPVAYGKTTWIEWSDNPILEGNYPSVLYDPDRFSDHGDAVTYKMWTEQGLQYFTSENGIKWNFVQNTADDLAGPVGHPLVKYYPGGFNEAGLGENKMYYRLWYWNEESIILENEAISIYYAESPDGIRWYNNQPITQEAPLLVTGKEGDIDDWNRGSHGPADVLYNPDAENSGTDWVFTMYYDGTDLGDESLGIAFSADGIHWIGHDTDGDGKADPVLVGGGANDWDGGDPDKGYVSRATVIRIKKRYHMWYSGGLDRMWYGIGYARSKDGIRWVKSSANPIFHIDDDGVAWRTVRTYTPLVIYDPDAFCGHGQAYRYKMWFSGETSDEISRIGYAVGGKPSLDCFDIHETMVLRPKRKRNHKIFVLQATFWAEIPDQDDSVKFALDDKVLVNVSFDNFRFINNRYIYQYSDVGRPSIEMTLDFDYGTWQLTVNDVDLSDLSRKVEYRLEVGSFIGSLELKMRKKKDGLYYFKKNRN